MSVILWVVIYDQLIIPFARKFTGHPRGFTQLQRMGIGLAISILSMVSAAALEVVHLDYIKNKYYDLKIISMSIFWQVPQYFLIGCAEVFTLIGQVEFFYDQAPDAMISLCSAISLMAIALGSHLSTIIVTIVTRNKKIGWITENLNKCHLDYFFWLLDILSFINFMVFLWVSKMFGVGPRSKVRFLSLESGPAPRFGIGFWVQGRGSCLESQVPDRVEVASSSGLRVEGEESRFDHNPDFSLYGDSIHGDSKSKKKALFHKIFHYFGEVIPIENVTTQYSSPMAFMVAGQSTMVAVYPSLTSTTSRIEPTDPKHSLLISICKSIETCYDVPHA
ncbi:hypothetical protein RND71_038558 [Anisodus tanguticus]|uniref:Uncharacterized protein n=1 Tax=Anisodus tanguticus TaxID=243964 RepID=A0AAE1UTM1_9SOLA|nr:hypothetical protein RND71_038558 [Anisodus tanguticus]